MDRLLENKYIQLLRDQKSAYTDAALRSPEDRTEFGFGDVCGVYKGLILAEKLFNDVIGEEDDE